MRLMERLENIFSAAAFAEEGEFDTARDMVKGEGSGRNIQSGAVCTGTECLTRPPFKAA